jgi:RNase P/RNase MRP subunit p30
LREFETTDEPSNIKTLYFYNEESRVDYNEMTKEIIEEYKSGKLDPGREVGKIEKSRSKVRKLIENLKSKVRKV